MIVHFIRSSIGKKVIMAMTGVFLMLFLLLHLSINMFLFDGEKSFNNAVFFMRNNFFIKILEYVLALGFIIHIIFGITLHIKNSLSQDSIDYSMKQYITTFSSRNMIYTGFLVLGFLILHLMNFTIPMRYYHNNNKDVISDYKIVTTLFKYPVYTFIYIFSFLILGIHLNHGFTSSFQSLGLSNKKNLLWIKKLGCYYVWSICLGFSFIAIWFFLFDS
ncbi:succinate dehydrogenase [Blattabacterium cuenoti]|uniref:succinate dehydrogenase n=1 Tax=Blattabacterium cuenoti TaxID=1653831 RepID=UPI00163D0BD8|nr:succinate dehydrogenase [Blattabacterium cuenoti]